MPRARSIAPPATKGSSAATCSSAPKGRKTTAQGNALGHRPTTNPSPEGAAQGGKWPTVPLSDLAVSMKNGIYKHASAYAEDGIPCLRMYNIDDGRIVWKDIKRMRLTSAEIDDYGLLPGDLLVNRVNSRELVGKTAPIPDGLGPCVFESKNIRLRLAHDRVDPKWVSYKLLLDGSRYFDRNAQQVVGMASINQGQLGDFPIPIPPLPEQRRIVARVEELFSRLDAGVAALRHAKAQLQRYRQSVLAAAVTGQLTQAWREKHSDTEPAEELLKRILEQRREQWNGRGKYKEPVAPTTDHDLPENWVSTKACSKRPPVPRTREPANTSRLARSSAPSSMSWHSSPGPMPDGRL